MENELIDGCLACGKEAQAKLCPVCEEGLNENLQLLDSTFEEIDEENE